MKRIDIEHLVRWAYRDELPKASVERQVPAGFRRPWEAVSQVGNLLAVVQETDATNRYGVLPLLDHAPDDPHVDAVVVAEAVAALDLLEVELPEGWWPLSDMGDLCAEGEDAVRRGIAMLRTDPHGGPVRLRRSLSQLVVGHALLGDEPSWQAERPVRKPVMLFGQARWFRRVEEEREGAFGSVRTVVEIDGFDYRRRRPYAGAYRKFVLEPDPAGVVLARAEHELWLAALNHMAESLAGRLETHEALPPSRPVRPWEQGATAPRIIPSLRSCAMR